MANADAAFGFRPVANDGGVYTGQTQRCVFLASVGTAAYIGSVVKMQAGAAYAGGYQSVTVATLGDPAYGVVTSFEADPATSLEDQYRKASTLRFALVARCENTLFQVQETGSIGLAGVGFNAAFTTGTGSTVTGLANTELASTSIANTSTLDLQVVGGVDSVENDLTLSNAVWLVKFNDPQGKPVRTGV